MNLKVGVLVLLAFSGASAFKLDTDLSDMKPPNALKRIVNLLKEMKAELEQEAKDDSELYDKMVCYCETNNKEKTAAVAAEEQAIIDLGNAVNENIAKEATLNSEIEALKAGIAENKESLAKAEAMRSSEEAEFVSSEKEATESISATKNAIKMLEKHNSLSQTAMMQLRKLMAKNSRASALFSGIRPSHIRTMESFLQEPTKMAFLQQAPSAGSYAPQSGQIFGILSQMLETFEINSADAKKEEASAVATYADLKTSKTAEIAASNKKVTTKSAESAAAKELAASSKEGLADNRAALAADTEFLANLKVACDGLDRQFSERTKTRADETAAVADTIAILTSDDNSEQISGSFSFVQKQMDPENARVMMEQRAREVSALLHGKRPEEEVSTGLIQSSKKGGSKLNPAFASVKASVQKMKDDLKDQKQNEVEQKDDCVKELRKLDVDMTASTNAKNDAETKVADLADAIKALGEQVAALTAQISNTKVEMKKASENRELENKDFQATVTDQRATQAVLKKAVDRLKDFYEKASLLQKGKGVSHPMSLTDRALKRLDGFLQEGKQTPPAFEPYKKKGGAGGVMGMIQDLIDDSAKLEAEAVAAEKDAQAAYETFVNDSNASIAADTAEIANKEAEKGAKDGDKTLAQSDADAAMKDLMNLNELGTTLHKKCDFLVGNFEARQSAMDGEMAALDQSIAMLSGA